MSVGLSRLQFQYSLTSSEQDVDAEGRINEENYYRLHSISMYTDLYFTSCNGVAASIAYSFNMIPLNTSLIEPIIHICFVMKSHT